MGRQFNSVSKQSSLELFVGIVAPERKKKDRTSRTAVSLQKVSVYPCHWTATLASSSAFLSLTTPKLAIVFSFHAIFQQSVAFKVRPRTPTGCRSSSHIFCNDKGQAQYKSNKTETQLSSTQTIMCDCLIDWKLLLLPLRQKIAGKVLLPRLCNCLVL